MPIIKRLKKLVKVQNFAKSLDGIVEGIEHKTHKWCLGLQWHPEFLISNYDLKFLKILLEKFSDY